MARKIMPLCRDRVTLLSPPATGMSQTSPQFRIYLFGNIMEDKSSNLDNSSGWSLSHAVEQLIAFLQFADIERKCTEQQYFR